MTWFDGALILLVILFVAVGARLGSLWTAACLAAGFIGAYLVDYYALPVSGMIGTFHGADQLAALLLFVSGVAVVLLPGWILSRFCTGIFLGVVDSAFGVLTGGLASIFAVTLALLVVVPMFPKIESLPAWKQSALVKPLDRYLEQTFNNPHFRVRPHVNAGDLGKDAINAIAPAARKAETEISSTAGKIVDGLKKK